MKRSYTDEEFIVAVKNSKSWAEVFRELRLEIGGGTQITMRLLAKRLNLDIGHFIGQGWRKGCHEPLIPSRPLSEILVENSKHKQTSSLRKRLIREGVFEYKCYGCENTLWRGKPIPLELEHKNGIQTDNRIENLTLLCPNCHAQTDTYRGKNVGRFKKYLCECDATRQTSLAQT